MPTEEEPPSTTTIRDAACLILVDRSESSPRLLMGRRLATQVFLPNKWVFPGGRVEDDDRTQAVALAPYCCALTGDTIRLPFMLAAIRELFEEAGVVFANRDTAGFAKPAAWQQFARGSRIAAIAQLTPLARAITPPGLPRRFDTWFFITDREHAATQSYEPDGELLDLGWFTLAQVRGLDLPHITRLIVDDVASWLNVRPGTETPLIPFYFQDIDGYKRTLIDAPEPFLAP
jgi:8-oxo-dGTP pyrophosphatase MutT (NUDIX family)